MRINNTRVSELGWDDEALDELEQALLNADRKVIEEAYVFVSPDGLRRFGAHHEVWDGEMVLNRDGVYAQVALMRNPAGMVEELAAAVRPLRRRERVEALAHLRRHMDDMEKAEEVSPR